MTFNVAVFGYAGMFKCTILIAIKLPSLQMGQVMGSYVTCFTKQDLLQKKYFLTFFTVYRQITC